MSLSKYTRLAAAMKAWLEGGAKPEAFPKEYFVRARDLIEKVLSAQEGNWTGDREESDALYHCLSEAMRELSRSERIAQLRGWLTVLDALQSGNVPVTDEMNGVITEMRDFFAWLEHKARGWRYSRDSRESLVGVSFGKRGGR